MRFGAKYYLERSLHDYHDVVPSILPSLPCHLLKEPTSPFFVSVRSTASCVMQLHPVNQTRRVNCFPCFLIRPSM